MKKVKSFRFVVFAALAVVLVSCEAEPCQKCLEAQAESRVNDVLLTVGLSLGENGYAEGLTCPATVYVFDAAGNLVSCQEGQGNDIRMSLPDGVYDFAATVGVPRLEGRAAMDLRKSVIGNPGADFFLFGIERGVDIKASGDVSVPVRSYHSSSAL